MKIFFVGDFESNTGPAIANRSIRKALLGHENVVFAKNKCRLFRAIELIWHVMTKDAVCYLGYSNMNFLGLKFAQVLRKKSFYIMHGYRTLESEMNNPDIDIKLMQRIRKQEQSMFEKMDKIYCVSKNFKEYMQSAEPSFMDKFDFIFNGVDLNLLETFNKKNVDKRKKNQIVSIGGGMKRKNNLAVCKAIAQLNQTTDLSVNYIVIGKPYSDKEKIIEYDFVKYYDSLERDKLFELLNESTLYVQNSSFETFGLGIIEAIMCGCSLLVSKHVGSLGVFEAYENEDIITDVEDTDEIAEKLLYILKKPNYNRLKTKMKTEVIDDRITGSYLLRKIRDYMSG